MCLKFLLTRILRKREVQFKRPFFTATFKKIPMEPILIIVILVLLFGGAAFTTADGVFGSAH
jgi:hypothetical protein